MQAPVPQDQAMDQDLPRPATASQRDIKFRKEAFFSRLSRLKKKVLFASSPSDSLANPSVVGSNSGESQQQEIKNVRNDDEKQDWEIDQVVVDSEFVNAAGPHSRHGNSVSERNTSDPLQHTGVDPSELADSIFRSQPVNSLQSLVKTVYSLLHNFFSLRFVDPVAEEQFQKERWHNTKFLAWLATIFMMLNWVLYLIFNHSENDYERIAYYGLGTFFTLPLPVLVGTNAPRKYPLFFQTWLMCSSWFWGMSEAVQMKVCGFYTPHRNCGYKDFLFMMTYSIALPTLVLFSFNQKRLFAAFGAGVQFILLCALILPDQKIFVRNVISYGVFSSIFISLHYYQEQIDRRMFILRAQLKISFKAQQKAHMAEKAASNSKKRFVSYIFHEVRVPLNSALLAFQNLQANGAFKHSERDQDIEIHALEGSLVMMQKVLNDVLDLQRMDSGKFESSAMPFPFHQTLESMLGTLRVATAAKRLGLNIELDEEIDKCTATSPDGPQRTWVIGDSMRLRQVLSNLTSNAVKFTPEGAGSITVKTSLVAPPLESNPPPHQPEHTSSSGNASSNPQSHKHSTRPTLQHSGHAESDEGRKSSIVVRIEVTDSGPGIKPSDLQEARLFSPFVQTRLGLSQAGLGSGLGLAIVRQIVTLSGGRLGVKSRRDQGATFWVEFCFRLASVTEIESLRATNLPIADMVLPEDSPSMTHLGGVPEPIPGGDITQDGALDQQTLPGPGFTTSGLPTPPDRIQADFPHETTNPPQNANEVANIPQNTHNDTPSLSLHNPPTETAPSPRPPPAVPSEPETPLRVLVVDDDEVTRMLMSRMLSRLGCQVHTAINGQECLDVLLGHSSPPQYFDLVSLDNAMPVMTGQQAVKKLRALGRTDFVVGITGNALKEDQNAYIAAGADEVLAKPVMMKSVKTVLQTAKQRRAQQVAVSS